MGVQRVGWEDSNVYKTLTVKAHILVVSLSISISVIVIVLKLRIYREKQ